MDKGKDFKKKIRDTAKSFYNYMELFLCRTSRLAKDNARGRIIIFPHYLGKNSDECSVITG